MNLHDEIFAVIYRNGGRLRYASAIETEWIRPVRFKIKVRRQLNVGPRRKWSDDELKYLIENYKTVSRRNIGKTLNRTTGAVEERLRRLREKGMIKSKNKSKNKYERIN